MRIPPLIFVLLFCIYLHAPAFAQSNNKVQSLGEILNEKPDYDSDGKPLTSAIMANHYYKNCVNKESLVFNKNEKKILCGCTSAEMSEVLSVQDFKNMEKKTRKGKDARGRMLAYAYAPCMDYVIHEKIRQNCRQSKSLEDIVSGKKIICSCVIDRFKQFLKTNASYIITDAIHHDPMTLDPLEYYFTRGNYYPQRDVFMRQCRYKFEHARDNR